MHLLRQQTLILTTTSSYMIRRRRMGATVPMDHPRLNQLHHPSEHGPVVEEIAGLIKVYKDGHVERLPAIPEVPPTWSADPDVVSRDVLISHSTGVWARFYVPKRQGQPTQLLPLLLYFHGGGFCVGSAAWSCYHEFLAQLSARAGCVITSVNYRLAPEYRLPTAYEDGVTALKWVRQQASQGGSDEHDFWKAHCNFAQVFVGGDSAGAAIAYNVAMQMPACIAGAILIQPFFGGEARTGSEKNAVQPQRSALSLPTSDCYWRLALPLRANRDHRWCNPFNNKGSSDLAELKLPPMLVCIAEMDILKDRNLDLCSAMKKEGICVEQIVYRGVGHAFQVLHLSQNSQARAQELIMDVKGFISGR